MGSFGRLFGSAICSQVNNAKVRIPHMKSSGNGDGAQLRIGNGDGSLAGKSKVN